MRTITLPHHTLTLYAVADFAASQFLRFQTYWEQALSGEQSSPDATTEALAFAGCVAAIDGHVVEPLPTAELPTLAALLQSYGVTPTLQVEALHSLQESSITTLKQLFPEWLADLTLEAMTDEHMRRRFLAACAFEQADITAYLVATGREQPVDSVPVVTPIQTQQQLDEQLLDWLQPSSFGRQRWLLAQELRERAFAALYELLTRTGIPHPEELPVVAFVRALEMLRPQLSR